MSLLSLFSPHVVHGDLLDARRVLLLAAPELTLRCPLQVPTTVVKPFVHVVPFAVAVHLAQFRHLVLEEFWRARDQVVVHVRADQTDERAVLVVGDEQRRAQLRPCNFW